MTRVKDIAWWYWLVTTILLIGVVTGNTASLLTVIALNIVQVIHYIIRERNVAAFPVQVRVTYLGLLFLAQAPYMFWIFWVQLIGTTAMVMYDYCFLARCLSLMPCNKTEEYSLELIKRTFFSAPVEGNVLQGLPARPDC
jgi:hypothetical protein